MNDYRLALRQACYDCLANGVVIDSAFVPVKQDKLPEDEPTNCYILIGDIIGNNISPLDHFASDVTVSIHAVAIAQSEVGNYADDMANQIKQLMLPTRTTSGLEEQGGFHFSCLRVDNDNDVPVLQTATGYVKQIVIRYRLNIFDNN